MKDGFYCSVGKVCIASKVDGVINTCERFFFDKVRCPAMHRKHPTPEQFREEYGRDVGAMMPVWYRMRDQVNDYTGDWDLVTYQVVEEVKQRATIGVDVVVACTPFGCP